MRIRQIYLALIFTFLIGVHDGFIALWTPPEKAPAVVFPYAVTSLPPQDQQRVKEGIHIENEEELRLLLEDYLS